MASWDVQQDLEMKQWRWDGLTGCAGLQSFDDCKSVVREEENGVRQVAASHGDKAPEFHEVRRG